jgi:hypothetical protein
MNPLEQLDLLAIPVTWATVATGLEGPGSAPPQIGLPEVRSWLEASLRRGREPERAIDVLVAIDNDSAPNRLISGLASESGELVQDELRKWQLVMLRRQLADLPPDPFYTAVALADFWSQFGNDADVPTPTAEEFGSVLGESDRRRMIHRQEAWLATTGQSLSSRAP